MNTKQLPVLAPAKKTPGDGIEYGLFLDCVHCGLCTSACPTYVELGDENDSPRGRIYLMRAVTDGRLEMTSQVQRHLELCLDCRACETACPSGVQYGKLIEPFRVAMEQTSGESKTDDWFHKWILFGLFPYPNRLRTALAPARIAQRLGLVKAAEATGLLNLLPPRLKQLVAMLPPLKTKNKERLPRELPAKGKRRARVALFTGCIGDVMFSDTNWATARVLQENGCEVVIPQGQACCGAIHLHAGSSDPARKFADANAAAFDPRSVDAIIVNVAGCGSMLKDYGHHWENDEDENENVVGAKQQARAAFAAKVKDINEFLDELGLIEPTGSINYTATYHDACHLAHAQKIREAPRNLLSKIPGLELVDLPETDLCCGAAGTYNLTEPEMAGRLSQRKLKNILSTGARVVVTANAGCLLQIMREARSQGHKLSVVHPIDLLDMSYRGETIEW